MTFFHVKGGGGGVGGLKNGLVFPRVSQTLIVLVESLTSFVIFNYCSCNVNFVSINVEG